MGQQFKTPFSVIAEKGSDVIIVGRGIYKAADPAAAAKQYQQVGRIVVLAISCCFPLSLVIAHACCRSSSLALFDRPPGMPTSTASSLEASCEASQQDSSTEAIVARLPLRHKPTRIEYVPAY